MNRPFADENYVESVKNLVRGTATKRQFVEAITGWQNAVDGQLQDTEMSFAVSRRTLWLFPSGHTLVTSPGYGPHISDLNGHLDWESPAPVPMGDQHKWLPETYVNGWRPAEQPFKPALTDEILEAIDAMTEVNGTPKLIIPWLGSWASNIVAQEDFYALGRQGMGPPDVLLQSVQAMFNLAIQSGLENQSPWEIEYTSEEAYMSSRCGYMEFKAFLEELENRRMAIVIRNAAHHAWRDDAVAQEIRNAFPELEEIPIVWVPITGACLAYHPSGWVYEAPIFVDDVDLEKEMYRLADEISFGLRPKWSPEDLDEEWEAEGIFWTESELDEQS